MTEAAYPPTSMETNNLIKSNKKKTPLVKYIRLTIYSFLDLRALAHKIALLDTEERGILLNKSNSILDQPLKLTLKKIPTDLQ